MKKNLKLSKYFLKIETFHKFSVETNSFNFFYLFDKFLKTIKLLKNKPKFFRRNIFNINQSQISN